MRVKFHLLISTAIKPLLLIVSLFLSDQICAQKTLPVPDHIVIVILENHSYAQIINSPEAPYINSLVKYSNSALFTNSYGIGHPSQPNYLALYSGSDQGVKNDHMPKKIPFSTSNLGRQLIDTKRTFITYSEDLPFVGFNGEYSGNYVRKHNPATNWIGTGENQIPAYTSQPLTAFPSSNFDSLPTVCYLIPNQSNNMHNGSIKRADTWIFSNLNNYINWAKNHNSLLILTFDEDNYISNNKILTIFNGGMVKGGKYSKTITHYNILRTIEDMYALPYAGKASKVSAISDCWVLN